MNDDDIYLLHDIICGCARPCPIMKGIWERLGWQWSPVSSPLCVTTSAKPASGYSMIEDYP